MQKNIFIPLILFFGELIKYTLSEIRLPFRILHRNNNDSTLFIDKLTQNQIYTNISFGTPPQQIQLIFKMPFELFYLPSSLINTASSGTMTCTSTSDLPIDFEEVERGYYCTDIVYLNNTGKRVDFVLNEKNGGDYGSIGLLIQQESTRTNIYPFFQSLSKSNLIKSYTWTLKYFKNISLLDSINGDGVVGEFIFGDEPHKYEKDQTLYPVENYHVINPTPESGYLFWDFEFNDVYLTLKNGSYIFFEGTKKAEINPESNYLVGPSGYFTEMKKLFFSEYFDENICIEEKINNKNYGYISCDKNKFNYNNFPILTFEHKSLENKFNLTGNDLFVLDSKTNKYIFLIFTSQYTVSKWILGSPFLKNHQLIFDNDKKTIGYYVANITNSEKEKEKESKTSYIIISVLVLVIITIFVGTGVLIKKGIIQLPRKKRANELEENIIYEENGGKNNDDIGNINS